MRAKPVDSKANGFAADGHTAFGEKIFDICATQSKPIIGPHGIYDHGTRVTEAFEARERGWCFRFRLPPSTAPANNLARPARVHAIGAMFDQVLEAANIRLDPMTCARYRRSRDLEIEVFDIKTGKARPTVILSGGETFIAALALAPVVESLSGKIRMDTIFIDEGFGSLDTENGAGTLDLVIQVLAALIEGSRAVAGSRKERGWDDRGVGIPRDRLAPDSLCPRRGAPDWSGISKECTSNFLALGPVPSKNAVENIVLIVMGCTALAVIVRSGPTHGRQNS